MSGEQGKDGSFIGSLLHVNKTLPGKLRPFEKPGQTLKDEKLQIDLVTRVY